MAWYAIRLCVASKGKLVIRRTGAVRSPAGIRWLAAKAGKWSFGQEIKRLRTLHEHLAFFEEQRDFLSPEDLCSLLEGLWQRTLIAHGVNNAKREWHPVRRHRDLEEAQRDIFNSGGFMRMMKDLVRKLEAFGPVELPRMFAVLHDMRWHDRILFKIAEPMTVRHLPLIAAQDLSKVVSSYVGARCGSRVLFDELVNCCLQSAKDLRSSDLVALIDAFSQSLHKPRVMLTGLDPAVLANLQRFSAEELARIAFAYTHREDAQDRRDASPELTLAFAELLCKRNLENLHQFSTTQLVAVLQAFALWWKHRPEQRHAFTLVFREAVPQLLAQRESLHPVEASTLVWAFCRVTVASEVGPPAELLCKLHADLLQVVRRLPESSLAPCLLAFARLASGQHISVGSRPGVEKEDHNDLAPPGAAFVEAAESHVRSTAANFPARELTSVVLSYTLLRTGSAELFAVLQQACMVRCRQFPTEQAASVLWSFATVRLGNLFFREVQLDILERLNQFTMHAVCDILWAYCVVRFYDPHFFKTLLSTLVPSKVARDPRCALLCPALLDVRRHFPDFDPEGLQRYISYVSSTVHSSQLALAPPAAALDSVSNVLDSLGFAHELLVDVDGYAVDALVTVRTENSAPEMGGDSTIAVLLHWAGGIHAGGLPGSGTLHQTTGQPLGQAMMRQRHLTKGRGFAVVNLWDKSWSSLDADGRAAFLHSKILAAHRQPAPALQQLRTSRARGITSVPGMTADGPDPAGASTLASTF